MPTNQPSKQHDDTRAVKYSCCKNAVRWAFIAGMRIGQPLLNIKFKRYMQANASQPTIPLARGGQVAGRERPLDIPPFKQLEVGTGGKLTAPRSLPFRFRLLGVDVSPLIDLFKFIDDSLSANPEMNLFDILDAAFARIPVGEFDTVLDLLAQLEETDEKTRRAVKLAAVTCKNCLMKQRNEARIGQYQPLARPNR